MGNGISEASIDIVSDCQNDIEGELNGLSGDASAADILQATVNINDATNQSSAAISATQKENQMEMGAIQTLK